MIPVNHSDPENKQLELLPLDFSKTYNFSFVCYLDNNFVISNI